MLYMDIYIYMVTFTINIPPMLAYIPCMDPMGYNLPGMVTNQIGHGEYHNP